MRKATEKLAGRVREVMQPPVCNVLALNGPPLKTLTPLEWNALFRGQWSPWDDDPAQP
jgi:hypothetical protein